MADDKHSVDHRNVFRKSNENYRDRLRRARSYIGMGKAVRDESVPTTGPLAEFDWLGGAAPVFHRAPQRGFVWLRSTVGPMGCVGWEEPDRFVGSPQGDSHPGGPEPRGGAAVNPCYHWGSIPVPRIVESTEDLEARARAILAARFAKDTSSQDDPG